MMQTEKTKSPHIWNTNHYQTLGLMFPIAGNLFNLLLRILWVGIPQVGMLQLLQTSQDQGLCIYLQNKP